APQPQGRSRDGRSRGAGERRLGDSLVEPPGEEGRRADVRILGRRAGTRRNQGLLQNQSAMVLNMKRWITTALVASAISSNALAQAPAASATKISGDADRKQVTITVYNQNFGLVREVRELKDLGTGRVALEFRDVASTIQPETVAVKPLGGGF